MGTSDGCCRGGVIVLARAGMPVHLFTRWHVLDELLDGTMARIRHGFTSPNRLVHAAPRLTARLAVAGYVEGCAGERRRTPLRPAAPCSRGVVNRRTLYATTLSAESRWLRT